VQGIEASVFKSMVPREGVRGKKKKERPERKENTLGGGGGEKKGSHEAYLCLARTDTGGIGGG